MHFLANRLKMYKEDRNDPTKPKAQSNLSPWIHFGQLSAQRIILELQSAEGYKSVSALFPSERTKSAHDFAEELVVRREVAENFCLYQPLYDVIEGASGWAQESLTLHSKDKRDFVYSRAQFEAGKTHEDLWNACQLELVNRGKLHGWSRMYWAKKILEWSASPQDETPWQRPSISMTSSTSTEEIQTVSWGACGPLRGFMIWVGRKGLFLEK